MGPLGEAAGVYGDPDLWPDDEAPERTARLIQVGMDFIRAGGSPTIAEFAAMSEFERVTLAVAGDKLAARQAVQIARAARSEQGEQSVLAILDGGSAAIAGALRDILDKAEA